MTIADLPRAAELYQSGLTLPGVGAHFDVSGDTVRRLFLVAGITRRPQGRRPTGRRRARREEQLARRAEREAQRRRDTAEAVTLYRRIGNVAAVARQMRRSQGYVARLLHAAGVDTSTPRRLESFVAVRAARQVLRMPRVPAPTYLPPEPTQWRCYRCSPFGLPSHGPTCAAGHVAPFAEAA